MHVYYLGAPVIWWQVSIGYLDVVICFMPNLCLVNKALICKCQDTIKLKGSYFNNDSVVINQGLLLGFYICVSHQYMFKLKLEGFSLLALLCFTLFVLSLKF